MIERARLQAAYAKIREQLWSERTSAGHWVGQLSTSALSTATAVSALALVGQRGAPDPRFPRFIAAGLRWLAEHQNPDGGWGDTDRSYSNIATTMLVQAAFHLAGVAESRRPALDQARQYIDRCGAVAGLRKRYGRDKTFAAPILTNCALAGLVPWEQVPALPFELACVPQRFYRWAHLPVVSYAIPALVAIGQARYLHCPPRLTGLRWLRRAAVAPSLRVLQRMQPDSGGYLEAAPLTSFVVMSLAACGNATHPVAQAGVRFLIDSVRPDGSWPIDTNLATWVTTLAIHAAAASGEDVTQVGCLPWLLACQHRRRHPFTGADPGGWGWSDLSGAVPDADDTPGALLALAAWRDAPSCTAEDRRQIAAAAAAGMRWLEGLQNRDGGWPTFCRGWGKLPFDRSGADLTAHALRALQAWKSLPQRGATANAVARGFRFLKQVQRADGSWVPLWFGNQDYADEENPVYGTAKVLLAYGDCQSLADEAAQRGLRWLTDRQNADGGWGGGPALATAGLGVSSVEETGLAVEALAAALTPVGAGSPDARVGDPAPICADLSRALQRGVQWLVKAVESPAPLPAAPIGFYFAKLWYYEKLYPLLFTLAALGRAQRCLAGDRLG